MIGDIRLRLTCNLALIKADGIAYEVDLSQTELEVLSADPVDARAIAEEMILRWSKWGAVDIVHDIRHEGSLYMALQQEWEASHKGTVKGAEK